jgi:predicted transcriptional regulator
MLSSIEREAYDNPALVRELALLAQRDVALIRAALADIQRWMAEAKRGRAQAEAEDEREPPQRGRR